MNDKLLLAACAMIGLLTGCMDKDSVSVTVRNSGINVRNEVVELSAGDILLKLGGQYCVVTDEGGKEVPSQMTYDGQLIFPVSIESGNKVTYKIVASDTMPVYPVVTVGRKYPERADDIAWENELVGFRVYGPSTQKRGERAYGYDIFFKHYDNGPVLERLYARQTSPVLWQQVDSLRKIDGELAERFIKSFSYHVDHGLGMDCYAVGPSLGDGVAAIVEDGGLIFPWCYSDAEILDNGPVRFTMSLTFNPMIVGEDSMVVEHRLISLDRGSYLNHCRVWYDGLGEACEIVAGFPRRDVSDPVMDKQTGVLAYADPTQGHDNGKAMLGLIMTVEPDSMFENWDHVVASSVINPADTLDYYWGFAWDRAEIHNMDDWKRYLIEYSYAIKTPLVVTVR